MSKTNDAFRELTSNELDAVNGGGGVDLREMPISKLTDAPTPKTSSPPQPYLTVKLQDAVISSYS